MGISPPKMAFGGMILFGPPGGGNFSPREFNFWGPKKNFPSGVLIGGHF